MAFMLFWMDQYRWFGLTLCTVGVGLPLLALGGLV